MPSIPTTTIPALPMVSMDASLAFWTGMGFKVTYRQKAPNAYAVIEDEDYALHLFGLKQLRPEENFSTCLIIRSEVEELHAAFSTRLRALLGKVPNKGFPHITRMRPGQTRFTITDVAGNSVIFIKRGKEDGEVADKYKQEGLTPLQRAVAMAERLRDYKHDEKAAAKVLDVALGKLDAAESDDDVKRALEARLGLAEDLEEKDVVTALRAQLKNRRPRTA